MGRYQVLWTPEKIAKRIAEGRGQGEGPDYIPWLNIRDFSSKGRVHRVRGWKHGRLHHLFSDLEAYAFYEYEPPTMSVNGLLVRITDTREQHPLFPLEETIEIAKDLGVRHPTDPRTKYPVVMTTDLFFTAKRNLTTSYLARDVKYISDLKKPRTIEKLEIAKIYWGRRPAVDWGITTQGEICISLVENVKWMHPYSRLIDLYPLTEHQVSEIALRMTDMVLGRKHPLNLISRSCDEKLGLATGRSLAVVRYLLANQHWEVDLAHRIRTRESLLLVQYSLDSLFQSSNLRLCA